MTSTPDAQPHKLSSSKSIGVRIGSLRKTIDQLHTELRAKDPNVKISDLIRDGLEAFWPQIEAYLRAKGSSSIDPKALAALVLMCAKAQEYQITPEEVGAAMMELIALKTERPASPVPPLT